MVWGEGVSEELVGVGQGEATRDWEVAGVQCQEMEYLWGNQMEQGSLFLSCFSLNLRKSLSALPHDTKFGSCGDYCVRRLLKISSFQQMKKQ